MSGAPGAEGFAGWFHRITPYIREHRGRIFVLHAGGELLHGKRLEALARDIVLLDSLDIRLVLVYGVRPQVEALLAARDLESCYAGVLRITGPEALECLLQAAGLARLRLEAALSAGLSDAPGPVYGVSVGSGNHVIAQPVGVVRGVDCLYTGRVRKVRAAALQHLLTGGQVVLVPPVGYSRTGEAFNLSAAETACRVALALEADKLIFLGAELRRDAAALPGLENGGRQLSLAEARRLLESGGSSLSPDLLRRLGLGVEACTGGVGRVHLVGADREDALLRELFTRDGSGLLLTSQPYDTVRKACAEDAGGILELIEPLVREGLLLPRSRERLENRIGDFSVLVRDGAVIACAALRRCEPADSGVAELECFAVRAEYQGREHGELLLRRLEQEARAAGVRRLFLLTTQAVEWFRERGFREARAGEAPVLRAEAERARNSRVLLREIDPP